MHPQSGPAALMHSPQASAQMVTSPSVTLGGPHPQTPHLDGLDAHMALLDARHAPREAHGCIVLVGVIPDG